MKSLRYLKEYRSKNTERVSKVGLKKFFEVMYRKPDLSLSDQFVSEGRDFAEDAHTRARGLVCTGSVNPTRRYGYTLTDH